MTRIGKDMSFIDIWWKEYDCFYDNNNKPYWEEVYLNEKKN